MLELKSTLETLKDGGWVPDWEPLADANREPESVALVGTLDSETGMVSAWTPDTIAGRAWLKCWGQAAGQQQRGATGQTDPVADGRLADSGADRWLVNTRNDTGLQTPCYVLYRSHWNIVCPTESSYVPFLYFDHQNLTKQVWNVLLFTYL